MLRTASLLFFAAALLAATTNTASPLPQAAPADAAATPAVVMTVEPMTPEEAAEAAADEANEADSPMEALEEDASTPEDDLVALERRQFGPQVTPLNMHQSTHEQMLHTMAHPVAGALNQGLALPGGVHLSTNSFYANEVFALRNPHKGTCLVVEPGNEPKLRTARCNLDQAHTLNSRFAFHWLPAADNNLSFLATIYQGRRLCARVMRTGTRFFPCGPESTKYSLGATTKKGLFHVRDAGHRSHCMDAFRHSGLHMNGCRMSSRDQQWEKLHIAFLGRRTVLPVVNTQRTTIVTA